MSKVFNSQILQQLKMDGTFRNFRIVQTEGARKVVREVGHYNNVFDKLVEETEKK